LDEFFTGFVKKIYDLKYHKNIIDDSGLDIQKTIYFFLFWYPDWWLFFLQMRNIKLSAKEPRKLKPADSLIETLIASVFF